MNIIIISLQLQCRFMKHTVHTQLVREKIHLYSFLLSQCLTLHSCHSRMSGLILIKILVKFFTLKMLDND
jgi:hypothetical protein